MIDDEWKCDHDRVQVQDSHGHWNHELAVELVEQLPPGSFGGRSRSSSLKSQHGPQVSEHAPINKPLPIPHPTIITTSTSNSTTATTTTTSIIVSPAEEDENDLGRDVTENDDVESAPVPASSSTTITAAAAASAVVAAAIPTSTTRGSNVKSRDTYEAVLIFDETDDLSDGEGGRSKRQQVVESDDEDEELEDNNINNNIAIVSTIDNNSNGENATKEKEIVLLGEGEGVDKAEVTPQQDDHASLSPADQQQDNYPSEETSPVVIKVSACNAADAATANPVSSSIEAAEVSNNKVIEIEVAQQAVEEKKEVEQDASATAIEDVFINSSSVAESLPQLDEPSIIIPAEPSSSTIEEEKESPIAAAEEVAAPASIVEAKAVGPEVVETEKAAVVERAFDVEETPAPAPFVSSLAPTSVAIPASSDFSFESVAAQSHLLSPDVEPETFVLQAAVNLDEEDTGKDNDGVSEVEELEPDVKLATSAAPAAAPTKTVLEVVTDASAIAVATAAAAAAASANSTANDYSQVPSPPLTPSNLTSSKRDLLTGQINVESTEAEGDKQQQSEEAFERSVYMTPRAETTIAKHTTLEETTTVEGSSAAAAAAVEDENATIDILDDKDLPASLLSNSSSSSSLLTLNGGQSGSRRSSNSSTSSKASSSSSPHREMVEHDKSRKGGPEQYPNLLWSFCKTTAVVSAAVVILGLGLGRRRD